MRKIQLFNTLEICKNIFPIDDNNREINVYKINNAIATGNNIYYPNVLLKIENNIVLPLLERTMSLKSGTIYEKDNMIFHYNQKLITNNYEEPVFFFIYNTDNYFHFIYDSLPYLISYLQVKHDIPNLKLLMQCPNEQKKEMYPFVVEFLEILDIKKTDIVLIDEYTQYNEIYISTSYTHDFDSNLPPRKEIYTFYQDIVKNVNEKYDKPKMQTPKKIYVSRRTWLHNDFSNIGTNYTTRRRLVNEDELVEKLKTRGYEEVFTEKLTTIEKILYFSNATHVVGAIGGGISNVLFSPKTTKLEALVSPTFLDVNKRFKYSLDCVDVYYNFNTEHVEKTEFKTYMRVKTKDGNILGEIEKIYDNKLLVSYTDGSNTGWNAQNEYKQIELNMEDVEKLDDGLNSPWKIYF
jgi:hypothetical protein